MSEYFAISLVVAGLFLSLAVFTCVLVRHLKQLSGRVDKGLSDLSKQVDELSSNSSELQAGVNGHGRDLEAIRSEFAMYVTRDDPHGINYEHAIAAAASGAQASEICAQYDLRDAEAKLLVAVYGSGKSH